MDRTTWCTLSFLVSYTFSFKGWVWQNDRVVDPLHCIIWWGTKETDFFNYSFLVEFSSSLHSLPSKHMCISLYSKGSQRHSLRWKVQGTLFLLPLWKYNSVGAASTEHLPLPLPAPDEVDQLYVSLGAYQYTHSHSLLLLSFFFCEVGWPFFTFGMVIYFLRKLYFLLKDHRKECIIFSSLPSWLFLSFGKISVLHSTWTRIYWSNDLPKRQWEIVISDGDA